MHALVIEDQDRLDARRILAWAATIAAHALAVGMLALPATAPTPRAAAQTVAVALRMEPPPMPPPPAETLPRPKTKPTPTRARTPVMQLPAATRNPEPTPISDPLAEATVAPIATAPTSPIEDIGGETRQLAYAEPMRLRYPAPAIRARAEGKVLLKVLVDADGKVERIEIARSSGHAALDAAAREAVQRARFKPVLREGVAVPAWGLVPIAFRLDQA